ncbi:MAG: Holliday junction branch migration protein RuvA [Elusimicrobiales bacterium]|jgi:Holliday junction DNA helicase RuvA
MIASLRGPVTAKTEESAVIEAGGIGYEVFLCETSLRNLGPEGSSVFVLVAESISMYGGTALYGFLTREEKGLFDLFRDAVPNTGAKKALDYLNKALKSLPDFKQAVVKNDPKLLTSIFGFTAKTADKLIAALKDKLPDFQTTGSARLGAFAAQGVYAQVLNALASLGFRAAEAKAALEAAAEESQGAETAEQLLKRALNRLSPK